MQELALSSGALVACNRIRPTAVKYAAIGVVLGSCIGEGLAGNKGAIVGAMIGAGILAGVGIYCEQKQ